MGRDTTKRGFRKRRSRRKGSLITIERALSMTVKRLNLQEQYDLVNIRKLYADIFGNEINKISYPEKIIKKTLYLSVANSAWLMQLSLMKDEFVDKINERLKKRLVTRISFKVGSITREQPYIKPDNSFSLKKIKLDTETKEKIKESVTGIKDNALKKSIIAAKTAYYKRKQAKGEI